MLRAIYSPAEFPVPLRIRAVYWHSTLFIRKKVCKNRFTPDSSEFSKAILELTPQGKGPQTFVRCMTGEYPMSVFSPRLQLLGIEQPESSSFREESFRPLLAKPGRDSTDIRSRERLCLYQPGGKGPVKKETNKHGKKYDSVQTEVSYKNN